MTEEDERRLFWSRGPWDRFPLGLGLSFAKILNTFSLTPTECAARPPCLHEGGSTSNARNKSLGFIEE